MKRKIALLCDVEMRAIASAADTDNIYEIPLTLHAEGLDDFVLDHLRMDVPPPDLTEWKQFVARMEHPRSRCASGSSVSTWTSPTPTSRSSRPSRPAATAPRR